MNRGAIAFLVLVLVLVAIAPRVARADEPSTTGEPTAIASPDTSRIEATPPRLYLTPRFGSMFTSGFSSATYVVPALGVGLEYFTGRYVGLAVRYDATYWSRGTSELSQRRIVQQVVGTLDGRLRLNGAATLRAGVGGGASFLLTSTMLGDDSRTFSSLEPGVAWTGALDVTLPEKRVAFTFSASGLLHRASHDVLCSVGIAIALDGSSPRD